MRLLLSLGAIAMLLIFQNCAPTFKETSSSFADTFRRTFHYPYLEKPEYYSQIQLVTNASSAKFDDVSVIAAIGRYDGSVKAYTYELSITNQAGFPVCPDSTGQLVSGESTVVSSCTSNTNSTSVQVLFKVTVDGQLKIFTKTY